MQELSIDSISSRSETARDLTIKKVGQIRAINQRMRILALNALIEAARAGDVGRGFAVVSQEVRGISNEVEALSQSLEEEVAAEIEALSEMAGEMARTAQGQRMVDLALNAIEIVDRNLYERTCDVRWWATDSAFVACAGDPTDGNRAHAARRLGVIIGAYTVYLDLWLCDMSGKVLASACGNRHRVEGQSVADRGWFKAAARLPTGDDFHAEDVACEPLLGGAMVATYATAVRADGEARGKPIGVLGIHFDWEPQARTIVEGVRLSEEEKRAMRVLIVDSSSRVIAASDGRGILKDHCRLPDLGERGWQADTNGRIVAYHRTPGYETYRGLGWSGVIAPK
jgi:hypothetical protein